MVMASSLALVVDLQPACLRIAQSRPGNPAEAEARNIAGPVDKRPACICRRFRTARILR